LDNRQQSNLRTFLRLAPVPQLAKRLDLSNITLDELIQAAEEIFSGEAEKEALGTVITPPLISIRDKIGLITQRLGIKESASFKSLLGERPTRLEVVVTFLPLLELIKRYRVAVLQDELFGDIQIEREQGWNPNEELEIEFE
jgi:segregation and condensation protein A